MLITKKRKRQLTKFALGVIIVLYASCEKMVTQSEPIEITIEDSEIYLHIGDTDTINYYIKPDNVRNDSVTWRSNNVDKVEVNKFGIIEAKQLGNANITVTTINNLSANCVVEVIPISVESVTINKQAVSLKVGEETILSATISPEDATDKSLIWETEDNNIASVSENGTVTAINVGKTNVIVTTNDGALSDICEITVEPILVESITISPSQITMLEHEEVKLMPAILPENATDKTISWESDDPLIVSVSDDGTISAISPGEANIKATSSNKSIYTYCNIKVFPDYDKDGLNDLTDDLCPGTPEGEEVDSNGCSSSQRDSDSDGLTDDIDFDPENYFIRTDLNNNGIGDYFDPDYVSEEGKTKTVLEVYVVSKSTNSNISYFTFYIKEYFASISLHFRFTSSGWVYLDEYTSKIEWEQHSLNHDAFATAILNWVNEIPEINTIYDFEAFFTGRYIGEYDFKPKGYLRYVSIEE